MFNIRIIIEKLRYQNMPLYRCFIDYAKALILTVYKAMGSCGTRWTDWIPCPHYPTGGEYLQKKQESVVGDMVQHRAWSGARLRDITRGQDYKRFSSMDWCSTHNLCSEMTYLCIV